MLWANPDPLLKAPESLQTLFPERPGLCLHVTEGPRVGHYGTPGTVTLGIPREPAEPKAPGGTFLSCSWVLASFNYGYMPYCCGVGLVCCVGTASMKPKAWNELFNLVLPRNPHMIYLPTEGRFKGVAKTFEGVGQVLTTTRNLVHDSVIQHRMWTPTDMGNYFFDTQYPAYGHPTMRPRS